MQLKQHSSVLHLYAGSVKKYTHIHDGAARQEQLPGALGLAVIVGARHLPRDGLAGQGGGVDGNSVTFQVHTVGWDDHATLEQHDVTRHKLCDFDRLGLTIAPGIDRLGEVATEGVHGLLRFEFLVESNARVDLPRKENTRSER